MEYENTNKGYSLINTVNISLASLICGGKNGKKLQWISSKICNCPRNDDMLENVLVAYIGTLDFETSVWYLVLSCVIVCEILASVFVSSKA